MTTAIFTRSIRQLWLAASLAVLILFPAQSGAQPHAGSLPSAVQDDPYLVKEYVIGDNGTINVFTVAGNIDIISIPETEKVRIELYTDRSFSFWPSGDPLENYRITSLKRGNEITTAVEFKSKHKSGFWTNQTSFSYKITVPEAISTNLKTGNGHISVESVKGEHTFKVTAGDITVHHIKGSIEAYAAGGDVHINDSGGRIYTRADGGNINLENVMGEMRVRINGGTVSTHGLSGSMIAEVSGGNIEARFRKVGEGINLQTNAGNITLVLPRSTGYGLYARGSSVQFDEEGLFDGTYSSRLVNGSINGGGIPVNLTANFGNIMLQLKE